MMLSMKVLNDNAIKYTIDVYGQYTTQCNKMHYIDVYGQEKPHVYTCCGGGAIRGTSRGVRERNEGKFRPAFTLFTNTNRKTHFANKKKSFDIYMRYVLKNSIRRL